MKRYFPSMFLAICLLFGLTMSSLSAQISTEGVPTRKGADKQPSTKTQAKTNKKKKKDPYLKVTYGYLSNAGMFRTKTGQGYAGSTVSLDWGNKHIGKKGGQIAYQFALDSYVFDPNDLQNGPTSLTSGGSNTLQHLLRGGMVLNPNLGLFFQKAKPDQSLVFSLGIGGGMAINAQDLDRIDWVNRNFQAFQPAMALQLSPALLIRVEKVSFLIGYDVQFMGTTHDLKTDLMSHLAFAPQLTYFINR